VLSLLQQEFPDVTISKIRFLESQGLLDPERTPSGYRKFYAADVDRLRWILRQQREQFLPLKVIKDRLDGGELDVEGVDDPDEAQPAAGGPAAGEPAPASERLPVWMTQRPPSAGPLPSATPRPGRSEPVGAGGPSPEGAAAGLDGGASFTLEELAAAAGCDPPAVRRLVEYGLVEGRSVGRELVFDEDALVVAKLAGEFGRFGIEPRHLRLYRTQAEREAGLFEQVVLPLLKQRNPQARQRASEALAELGRLGDGMRRALLAHELRERR
jgi:DNA-binding transcriptional MerR regulator